MLKRQNRSRREYLYRKSLQQQNQLIYEKKQSLKQSLEQQSQLNNTSPAEAHKLLNELKFDENQEAPTNNIDDEYALSGQRDPKILITTSRDPSSKLQQFTKEIKLMFPNASRMNRGNYVIKDIVDACRSNDATDLIILHEHRGQPDGMVITHLPFGPTAYFSLHNVVTRHEIPDRGTVSEQYPHLIFNNFNSKLGTRVSNILKYLFPVPKIDSKRIMTFSNQEDFISFRHHVYQKMENQIQLVEVGPRFEMRIYEIKLGTVEVDDADTEWVWRPYQRTAKKQFHSKELNDQKETTLLSDDPEFRKILIGETLTKSPEFNKDLEKDEKRRRNSMASARSRANKKYKIMSTEFQLQELRVKCELLQARNNELELQVKWLKELLHA